jgi:hypothetical protein
VFVEAPGHSLQGAVSIQHVISGKVVAKEFLAAVHRNQKNTSQHTNLHLDSVFWFLWKPRETLCKVQFQSNMSYLPKCSQILSRSSSQKPKTTFQHTNLQLDSGFWFLWKPRETLCKVKLQSNMSYLAKLWPNTFPQQFTETKKLFPAHKIAIG